MPRNPFAIALPSSARSKEYGYPQEGFEFPVPELEEQTAYPELTDGERGVQAIHANSGDVLQAANPEYAGRSELKYMNAPGIQPGYSENVPAPGSQSLSAPRDANGSVGTNRLIVSEGPVRGDGADGGNTWSGTRQAGYRPNISNNGPVSGGNDYGTAAQLAYFASQAQQLSQEAINSALVSAV